MAEQLYPHKTENLPVYHPEEALRRDLVDLLVDDEAEMQLAANRSECRDYFARVHANSVHDLQILGLVPRGLREEELKQAMSQDDRAAFETAREISSRGVAPSCACGATPDAAHIPYGANVALTYAAVRKAFNPALAALLSTHQKTTFRWDSIHTQAVRGWLDRLNKVVAEVPVLIALFRDIRVGHNSRVVLDPQCAQLFARGIYIHKTGTLVHQSGYLRIWASEISRGPVVTGTVNPHIPWALN